MNKYVYILLFIIIIDILIILTGGIQLGPLVQEDVGMLTVVPQIKRVQIANIILIIISIITGVIISIKKPINITKFIGLLIIMYLCIGWISVFGSDSIWQLIN